jgi:hypothetical protein
MKGQLVDITGKLLTKREGSEPHEFKKHDKFIVGGWLFNVVKITSRGVICMPLGVITPQEESNILGPDGSRMVKSV